MDIKKLFLTLLIILLSACSSGSMNSDDLVGVYSILERGRMRDLIKIEKQDTAYIISEKRNNKWREDKSKLKPVTRKEFGKLFNRKVSEPFVGLKNKGIAIFKVPKDWHEGKFKTTTGYFMIFMLGPVELYKK